MFSIFFLSCEKDFDEINTDTKKTNFKVKVEYGENFFKEKPNIRQHLIKKHIQLENARMVSNEYNFEIDEEQVQIIETSNYNVYTFVIDRENSQNNLLENYILIEFNNDSIKHFIAQYSYDLVNGTKIFNNNSTINEINNPNLVNTNISNRLPNYLVDTNCQWIPYFSWENIYIPGNRCGCHGNHVYGDNDCNCPSSPSTPGSYQDTLITTWVYECYTSGGGNTDNDSSNDNPAAGDDSTNNNGSNNDSSEPLEEIITVPFVKGGDLELDNRNCEDLKIKSSELTFKQKMQELSQDANGSVEAGIAMYENSPAYSPKEYGGLDSNGNSFVKLTLDPNRVNETVGFMHCHLNTTNPYLKTLTVFSLSDFIGFKNVILNSSASVEKFAMYVTTNRGTFAIKLNSKQTLIDFANYIENNDDIILKDFESKVKYDDSKSKQIKGLLEFIDKFSNGTDIELYESDSNFNNWERKYLDADKKVKSEKC